MDLSELIKQQGLVVPPAPPDPKHVDAKVNPKKKSRPNRRPWLEEEKQNHESSLPTIIAPNTETVSNVTREPEVNTIKPDVKQTLDKTLNSRTTDVSQTLDSRNVDARQALDSREVNVKQTLEISSSKPSPVSQTLDKTLDSREVNVKQTLDSRETAVRTRTKEALEISHLIGNEKTLVLYACEECRKIGSLETNYISNEEITSKIPINSNGLRNLVHRIKQKGYFTVKTKSLGKTALRKFTVPQLIYKQIPVTPLDSREVHVSQTLDSRETDVNQPLAKPLAKPLDPSPSSGSGFNESNTTPTGPNPDKKRPDLPPEWQNIDYSCLASIGFKDCHLRQIFEAGKSTPEMVQESIFEMDHDVKIGGHNMRSPLLVLLKLLKGSGEPYCAINPGYVSDQVKYERKRLEELQRRDSEVKRLKEQQQEILNRSAVQQEEGEFQAWLKTKTEEEIKLFAGNFNISLPGGQAMLRNAFRAEKELIRSQIEQSLSN